MFKRSLQSSWMAAFIHREFDFVRLIDPRKTFLGISECCSSPRLESSMNAYSLILEEAQIYELNLDARGRIYLPLAVRRKLDNPKVVTLHGKGNVIDMVP
jgi:DNA-binding transcriptional regulator/RsmH inhibitor MraZ